MMARIRQKSEKKGIVMTLLTLLLIGTACNDQTDNPTINPSVGEMVEVSLNIGFAHETDASTLLAANTTKSTASPSGNEPLSVQLVPATRSAEATTARPDQFYNLEIYQYDANGTYLANTIIGTVAEGPITATLNNSTAQLLIIARGQTPAISSFANKSLSDVRKLTASANIIKAIGVEDGTNINNMPYLLYLPEVKIESNILVSPEGVDVRLLLKRLAVGLKLDWTISQSMINQGYVLKEARLMQVPADYRILPDRETEAPYGEMYPTSISEFIDGFRLKGEALDNAYGSATLWLPANARGTRRDINVPNQKSKRRAHSSATYIEFVVDNSANRERLFYRVYLGANMTTDFNLLENTNYHWTIKIETPNYTTDERVQLLDQTPVISANEQPTANCFMMLPGTNICFNPYKHEAGTDGWNTYLTDGNGTLKSGKEITKVKVLWQTKDAGTSGDLVLGYFVDETNHKNLVNLTDGSNINDARIHVKVPNTNGGNALIAAYNNNTIVWSWHIWISPYVPVTLSGEITSDNRETAIAQAQKSTVGGTVHAYNAPSWTKSTGAFYKKVIMDRNLGAIRNTFSVSSNIEAAQAYGVLYQWGRKDPMPGSADGSSVEINTLFNGNGEAIKLGKSGGGTLENSIMNPSNFYQGYYTENLSWGPESKTIYDPCPKGWKVPDFYNTDGHQMLDGLAFGVDNLMIFYDKKWYSNKTTEKSSTNPLNGFLYMHQGETISDEDYNNYSQLSVWFPATRLRETENGNLRTDNMSMTMLSARASTSKQCFYTEIKPTGITLANGEACYKPYGMSVRCIQEK